MLHLNAFTKNGKWGYMNVENEVIIPSIYDNAEKFKYKDFAVVEINEMFGLIDRKGKRVCPIQYEFIFRIEKDLIKVVSVERDGIFYIDPSTGGEIIERYDKTKFVNIATMKNIYKIVNKDE